ncbi:MAG TPA: PAS domain-containing sensor histidine kinase [Bacteroidota bacterium]|nr:PAS domain-containing sensor histidine kinase [Bacteroidota bacterium]
MRNQKQGRRSIRGVSAVADKSKSENQSKMMNVPRQAKRSERRKGTSDLTLATAKIKKRVGVQNNLWNDLSFTRNFLAAIKVGVALLANRTIIGTNDHFCKMTGYKERELIGKPARLLYPEEEQYLTKGRILYDFVDATKKGTEGMMRRKDGSLMDVRVYVCPFDRKRASRGFVVTIVDISARKKAERTLESSMEQLHALTARLEDIREDERRSLSRELHDQLGQILSAISLDLEAAKKLDAAKEKLITRKLDSALELTDNAIGIVKNVSARLRPSLLDHLGLLAAIEWLTNEFERITEVPCERDLPAEELEIDESRATALFRILQEALTNVARHARAKKVKVSLKDSTNEIVLSVVDNGIGISDRDLHNPKSIGLLGIQERLRPLKGISTFRRGPHGGTEVLIRVPKSIKE